MLGGHPTVTPPMWTTLATGCYANVHGITGFDISYPEKGLDYIRYSLNSDECKAEQVWNVFAEAGKKTLVWHWPGSSWPPTSDNPNLHVIDGTSPGSVAMSFAQFDADTVLGCDPDIKEPTFRTNVGEGAVTPCAITGMEVDEEDGFNILTHTGAMENHVIVLQPEEGSIATSDAPIDIAQSPIKDPTGWANAPEGAKEITILLSHGKIVRPALVLKNDKGEFDRIAMYKSKKDEEPMLLMEMGKLYDRVEDEGFKDDKKVECTRNFKILELQPDASHIRIYISAAMLKDIRPIVHPQSMWDGIEKSADYAPPTAMLGLQSAELINDIMLNAWYVSADWQAAAIQHLIDDEGMEVIFSHFHAIDLQEHMFIRYMTDKGYNKLPSATYCKFMEDLYVQTDYYLGKFLHYLDEGWTIILTSDHAQLCSTHDFLLMADLLAINVVMMEELGLTKLKRDKTEIA